VIIFARHYTGKQHQYLKQKIINAVCNYTEYTKLLGFFLTKHHFTKYDIVGQIFFLSQKAIETFLSRACLMHNCVNGKLLLCHVNRILDVNNEATLQIKWWILRSNSNLSIKRGFIYLLIYCFTSHSRIFHLYGEVITAGEELQNLGLCSALRAFEQERGLYCASPNVKAPRFFRSPLKDCPI
jgi:hypothetical protein